MTYIDTHTHIYLEQFDNDRADAVARARAAGVNRQLMPNVDSETIDGLMAAAIDFPGVCLPMMALHPTSVRVGYEKEMEVVAYWLGKEKFCAIGETGMDLYWDKTYVEEQKQILRRHVDLSLQYELPLVLHSRKSLNEIFEVLRDYSGSGLTGVFHCFPGSVQDAERALEFGFYLGIGGVVTYKNSTMARVVEAVGLDHIVLETDAPYLPPVPHRGKRNESAYIPFIAEKVAEVTGASIDQVAAVTTQNANKLFKISDS